MDLINETRKYVENIELVYCDTDSLGYKVTMTPEGKGKDHDFLFSKTIFSKYLDRSNFDVLTKDNGKQHGSLGLLKSEVGDAVVHEAIFLSPKCYSLKSYPRTCADGTKNLYKDHQSAVINRL